MTDKKGREMNKENWNDYSFNKAMWNQTSPLARKSDQRHNERNANTRTSAVRMECMRSWRIRAKETSKGKVWTPACRVWLHFDKSICSSWFRLINKIPACDHLFCSFFSEWTETESNQRRPIERAGFSDMILRLYSTLVNPSTRIRKSKMPSSSLKSNPRCRYASQGWERLWRQW